jgi:mannosyltransferase
MALAGVMIKALLTRLRWPELLGTFGLLGLAVWLRWPYLGESLWLDELHTAWVVGGTWNQLIPRAHAGNTGPLFFLLTRLVTDVFGNGELSLRYISLASGLIIVVASFLVMCAWGGRVVLPFLGAFLVAIDPNHIYFSLEARSYALVQLLGLIQVIVFWQLLQRPSIRWRMSWILLSVALYNLHYTAGWIVIANIVTWIVLADARQRYAAGQFGLDLGLMVIANAATLPHLAAVAEQRHLWSVFVSAGSPVRIVTLFPATELVAIALAGLAVAWMTGLVPDAGRKTTSDKRELVTYLACCLLVPVVGAWLLTKFGLVPLFHRRYLMVTATTPYLLFVVLTAICPSPRWRLVVMLVGVGLAISQNPLIRSHLHTSVEVAPRSREDWRGVVQLINQSAEYAQLPVMVRSGLIEADRLASDESHFFRQYCSFPLRSIYQVADTHGDPIPLANLTTIAISEEDRDRVRRSRGAWLVFRGPPHEAERLISNMQVDLKMESLNPRVAERREFGRLILIRWAF